MKEDEIRQWLEGHKTEMIDDICRLIRIDSTRQAGGEGKPFGEGPAEAINEATAIMNRCGFAAKNLDNYVCICDLNENEAGLDILAHLDVVPVDETEWTVTKPFEPVIKNDKLYGRGSADDKGPAMAALYAMRAVKELGVLLKKNVRLILGSDEECGGEDIEYYYSKHKSAEYTLSPDAEFPVINVERGRYASGFEAHFDMTCENIISIECGSKENVVPGYLVMKLHSLTDVQRAGLESVKLQGVNPVIEDRDGEIVLSVTGVSGHAAEPWDAVNALTATLELLKQLDGNTPLEGFLGELAELFPHGDYYGKALGIAASDEVSGELTISLNMLKLSEGNLIAVFDSRLPECAVDGIATRFEAIAKGLGVKLLDRGVSRPHIVSSDSEFVQTLLECYEEVSGKKGYTMAIGGGTYVHEIENGVAFGPVETDIKTNLHGFDENIPIESLMNTALIYALVIMRLCG